MVEPESLLAQRLRDAGMTDVVGVEPTTGGLAATAGIARRADGSSVFVKTFADPPSDDSFRLEASGLEALRDLGGMATPDVLLANEHVLVLSMLAPRPATESFWRDLAHALARLHTATAQRRFGWHHDNWLGRRRQVNTWTDDGFAFFAEHRLLRWLEEPRVHAALSAADRAALERLCDRLPELLPDAPACLTHGDLWAQNVLATRDGRPAVIDPAVSYTWAEVDLAHLWTTEPPPEAKVFFDLYADLTGLDAGWRDRMPILQLRQHLAVIAQFDDDWGAAGITRATLAPFRPRREPRGPEVVAPSRGRPADGAGPEAPPTPEIRAGGLDEPSVHQLLSEHLADMHATSPAESVHALDLDALRTPDISFWSVWEGEVAVGCAALKELGGDDLELKSMRTAASVRGRGIGTAVLTHVVDEARRRGARRVLLETGSQPFFAPARRLYARHGFVERGPFGDYVLDPNSCFFELSLR